MPYEWYTGMARLSSGQTDLALDSYRKAYAKNPYQIRLLNDLGTAYDKLHHPDSAIAYYSKALTYSKNCVDCRVNLSSVYFNLGRTKEAFETIDELRTQNIRLKGNESYENALYVITATRLDDSLKTISDTITVNKVSLFLNQRKNLLKAYSQFSTDNGPILPKIFQVASGQILLK
jgi:tetratricopeptide (TPR) repeat protein